MTAVTSASRAERSAPATAPLVELDALRGIAITAVVGMHVTSGFLQAAPPRSPAMWAALVLHLLVEFATPLFVALSMAGLALGYARPLGVGSEYRVFLLRRARRILPAYVFWTVLTLLRNDPAALVHVSRFGGHLLRGSAAFHFYFVPVIVAFYVAWPVLSRLAVAARRDGRAAFAIACAGIVATPVFWWILPTSVLTTPLFWLGYATLGLAAAPWLARLFAGRAGPPFPVTPIAALTAIAAVVMIERVSAQLLPVPDPLNLLLATLIFQVPVMVYTLAAMALMTAIVARGSAAVRSVRMLAALGRRSYGVYLAHVLVLQILHRIFGRPLETDFASARWAVMLLAEWSGCLAITWALIAALARIPGCAPFAGDRPSERALTAPPPSP